MLNNFKHVGEDVKKIFWWILFAAPFAIYFYYFYRYALNVPVYDDYVSMLKPMNSILTSPTFIGKLANLFSQHVIHRNTFAKFLVLCQYYLTGSVNFRTLLFISGFSYAALVLLLAWKLKMLGGTRYQLLPIPFILLAFSQYDNMVFFSAGGTFYWNELFVVILILLLDSRKYFEAAAVFPLTIFTNAGGLPMYPITIGFLLLQKSIDKFVLLVVCSTLTIALFFYKFTLPPSQSLVFDIEQITIYFLTFLGNATILKGSSFIAGIFIIGLLIIIVFKTLSSKPFFALTALWILSLAAFTTLSRASMGTAQALSSRYTIYSLLAITCIYMWAIITLKEKYPNSVNSVTLSAIVISILFFSGTVWWVENQNLFKEENLRAFGNLAITVEYPKTPDGQVLRESNRLGVYKFLRNGLKARPIAEVLTALPSANSPFQGNLDLNRDDIYLRGWSLIPGQDSFPSRIYLILKKDDLILKLETAKYERPDVSAFFDTPGTYDYSGYEAYPRAYNIPPGTYSLGILVENEEYTAFQWQENETIVIP